MYLSIVVFPLLGSIVTGFFGRKIGVKGGVIVSTSCIILTTILAIIAYIELGINNQGAVVINLLNFISLEKFNIQWSFQFDSLTVSMLIPVLIISSLVHVYSIGYMSADPHQQRFFSYLSLFTFMMIVLVTGKNYLVMFVGWEGIGVSSYLLVSFWFTRIAANQSSLSAFITNRVGDCFLTIGMLTILWAVASLDYSIVFSTAPYLNPTIVTLIGLCLLLGAMAKSAQLGLHVWLPLAMEGPTPVSALIHAATLVTAGIYLLIRSSPLIEYSETILLTCLWLGGLTTLFSSLIGLFQSDIKKIIAYSTMSQLGLMVIAIGLSSYNIALFHLVNHAFYKALLFLGAGSVIHSVGDNQDLRRYGGLINYLPLTYTVILIASLSLLAFPWLTGFYSKELILESALGYMDKGIPLIGVYILAVVGAIFTTLYSIKILYLAFLSSPNGPKINYEKALEESNVSGLAIYIPLVILTLFSIFFGYITKDIYVGLGNGFFSDNSIFIHPSHEILIDTEFTVHPLRSYPLIFTIVFTIIGLVSGKIVNQFKYTRFGYLIFGFFNQRLLVEFFYNKIIMGVLRRGGEITKVLDRGSIELVGPYGFEKTLIGMSKSLYSKGLVTSYALYIILGLGGFTFIICTGLELFTQTELLCIILLAIATIS